VTTPRLALIGSTAHAVVDGSVLCGAVVTEVSEEAFPGSGHAVCRGCSRAAAVALTSVPIRRGPGAKRPGGM
jgi:hypothetical protein